MLRLKPKNKCSNITQHKGNSGKKFISCIEPYLWLLPAFILFTVFTFYPFVETVFKSFFIVDPMGNTGKFVGIQNYSYILTDKDFVKAIFNTLLFVVLTVPISKVLGLLLALLANKKRKTSMFYEASFAIPMAMASSVTAMIFQLLYVPSLGFINGTFGLNVDWLGDPKVAMISIAVIQIWLSTGYAFIFMLSAVRSVPNDILENAQLEGASPFRQLISIYIPLTSPTMFFLIITDLAYGLMMMSLVSVLTDGGPFGATSTIIHYIFKQITATGNYTNANPAAVLAFIMTFITTMLGFVWEKKGVHYQ